MFSILDLKLEESAEKGNTTNNGVQSYTCEKFENMSLYEIACVTEEKELLIAEREDL